jgi:nicotinate phosphoribosyltransferase
MFKEPYLEFLRDYRLPEYDLSVTDEGQFHLEFPGPWKNSIRWETHSLSIINEMYVSKMLSQMTRLEQAAVWSQGITRLAEKVAVLKQYPWITFIEFGTRRRASLYWQGRVVEHLAEELPAAQFLGTSNTWLSARHSLLPMGTSAHELDMVYSGIFRDQLRASHQMVMSDWWNLYDFGLSVALTDTFGSEFFFRDMTRQQAIEWKGLRQDSGDPFVFGERAIKFYQSHGIDPMTKLIIFSDGLDLPMIIRLAEHFKGRIKVSFGWGTNLTNDIGIQTLSLVVKAIEAAGQKLVKLSDNPAKSIGPAAEQALYKETFEYQEGLYQECRY